MLFHNSSYFFKNYLLLFLSSSIRPAVCCVLGRDTIRVPLSLERNQSSSNQMRGWLHSGEEFCARSCVCSVSVPLLLIQPGMLDDTAVLSSPAIGVGSRPSRDLAGPQHSRCDFESQTKPLCPQHTLCAQNYL